MAEQIPETQDASAERKRTRGGTKAFPIAPLAETLVLAKAVAEHGVGDQIRRITLFDKLERSPESGHSRALVTNSGKYGLTEGSYAAETLKLLPLGRKVLEAPAEGARRKAAFDLGIAPFETFLALYERLKSKKLPADDVLRDEMQCLGVPEPDCDTAVRVFAANLESAGLVKELSGAKRVISIEQAVEEAGGIPVAPVLGATSTAPPAVVTPLAPLSPQTAARLVPSVHIDVQVHIDASASAEQIDQIFASMAKHLGMGPNSERNQS